MVFSEVISCAFSSSNWQYDCLETCINMNSSICSSHQRRMNCIFQLKTFHFGRVQYVHCAIHSFIIFYCKQPIWCNLFPPDKKCMVVSIAEYSTHFLYFDSPCGLVKIFLDLEECPTKPHTQRDKRYFL